MSTMPPDDAGRPDDAQSPDVGEESFVLEVSPYSMETDGAVTDDGFGGAIRWIVLGGIAILGLGIGVAVFVADNSTGDGITAEGIPATTLVPGSPDESLATGPSTTLVASIAPDAPVVGAVPLKGAWAYTAVKTADVLVAPDFFDSESVGASFSGVLVISEVCTDGHCVYRSTYDLGRTFLEATEGGQPTPAAWNAEGSFWFVELAAFVTQAGGAESCVVRVEETWKVSLVDLELGDEGWAASAFTGSLLRSTSSEPTLSNASTRVCGEWSVLDEWSVTGRAVSGS